MAPPRRRFGCGCAALLAAGLFLALTLSCLLCFGLFAWGGSSTVFVPDQATLEVDAGWFPETSQPVLSEFFDGPGNPSLSMTEKALLRAAQDEHIKSLLVRFDGELPAADLAPLRRGMRAFREAGKPVYAYLSYANLTTLAAATEADHIVATPNATLMIGGLASEVPFLRGTLDKLGVQAQFLRVGAYKSYAETWTETGMSDEFREELQGVLDALHQDARDSIAARPGFTAESADAAIARGLFTGREAQQSGLVDSVMYPDELDSELATANGADQYASISLAMYAQEEKRPPVLPSMDRIVVLVANGDITDGAAQGLFAETGIEPGSMTAAIRSLRDDPKVKAVVLRVNSPGGSAHASDLIWRELELLADEKPVVVSMGSVAASGGYYISMGADYIFAEDSTITGSIGVVGGKFALRGLYEKIGVNMETVQTAPNAGLASSTDPWTEEQAALMQQNMNAFYDEFIQKAADGRRMDKEDVHAVAQGRIWTGRQALGHGLVDEIGGPEAAIAKALELAQQEDASIVSLPVVVRTPPVRLFGEYMEQVRARQEAGTPVDPVLALAERMHVQLNGKPATLCAPCMGLSPSPPAR